jgi:hypothetical protein
MLSFFEQFTTPDDHDFGIDAQVARLKAGLWLAGLLVLASGGIALISVAAGFRRRSAFMGLAYAAGAAVGLCAFATGRLPTELAPQGLVFISASTVLLAGRFITRESFRREQLLLIMPALGAGAGWFLGSNGGLGTAVLASPLLFAAALFWWPSGSRASSEILEKVDGSRVSKALAIVGVTAVLGAVAAVGALNTPAGSTTGMTAFVQRGPFKGMLDTPQHANEQMSLVTAIERLPPVAGRTTYIEHFPLGYLIGGGALPGTYSTWTTSAESGRLQTYVDLTRNAPSRIVLTRFRIEDRDQGLFPPSVNLRNFRTDYALTYSDGQLRVFDLVRAPKN